MWTSLPTALMALLLLSDQAIARRKRTVTVDACQAPITSIITVSSGATATSGSSGILKELSNGEIRVPEAAVSTVTVIPLPMTTASGVFYPGLGSGTGSGYARPTGHHHHGNGTGNRTSPGNSTGLASGTVAKITSHSMPFFTIETTASLALPTNITSPVVSTSSSLISISIPSSSILTLTTSKIPSTTSSTIIPTASVAPTTSSKPTPTSTSTTAAPSATSTTSTKIPFLRGVNLGGWLVLESWMDGDLFSGDFASAVDQYTFDSIPGAKATLENHWETFFTESDILTIAATGINALRIPIGYWAYDNANTPYITGADKYLELAIGWARDHGMYVWVDCHGSPGSQNGFDNSGQKGVNEWQQGDNLERSISVLKTMAAKYGAAEYADVVVGLELTNEPISYGSNVFSITQSWAQEAYTAIKAVVENENLVIVMHDAFQTPLAWMDIGEALIGDVLSGGKKTFGIDTHLYQLYTDTENTYTQAQHITEACGWESVLAPANAVMPTYVGEWSAATNICVNPDGTTTAGTSCSVSGCQCQSADFDHWNDAMIEQVRRYVEAQLDVFESSSSGYFMWAAKGPGGWGFLNGIEKGVVPNPVTERKYGGQCGGNSRREMRGSLGVKGEAF